MANEVEARIENGVKITTDRRRWVSTEDDQITAGDEGKTACGDGFEGKLLRVDMSTGIAIVDIHVSLILVSLARITAVHRPLPKLTWVSNGLVHTAQHATTVANVRKLHGDDDGTYLGLVHVQGAWKWHMCSAAGGGELAAKAWCEHKLSEARDG